MFRRLLAANLFYCKTIFIQWCTIFLRTKKWKKRAWLTLSQESRERKIAQVHFSFHLPRRIGLSYNLLNASSAPSPNHFLFLSNPLYSKFFSPTWRFLLVSGENRPSKVLCCVQVALIDIQESLIHLNDLQCFLVYILNAISPACCFLSHQLHWLSCFHVMFRNIHHWGILFASSVTTNNGLNVAMEAKGTLENSLMTLPTRSCCWLTVLRQTFIISYLKQNMFRYEKYLKCVRTS